GPAAPPAAAVVPAIAWAASPDAVGRDARRGHRGLRDPAVRDTDLDDPSCRPRASIHHGAPFSHVVAPLTTGATLVRERPFTDVRPALGAADRGDCRRGRPGWRPSRGAAAGLDGGERLSVANRLSR